MCRQMAITATNLDPDEKALLMDHMMVVSMGDDDQTYGSGVSDGDTLIKSGDPYVRVDGLAWLAELDSAQPWIGHVRKPSRGVAGAESSAAHPYEFANMGNAFIATHNGWVANPYTQTARDINTDSWHALRRLARQLQGKSIDHEQLQMWARGFMHETSSSFLFLQDGALFGLRGQRPLYRFALGNGFVINTSEVVIRNMHRYTGYKGGGGRGAIEEIPAGTYFTDKQHTFIDITTQAAPMTTVVRWKRKVQRDLSKRLGD